MKTKVPNYYKKFKCIADKCRHSCCIGWEIDIDSDKLDYYNSIGGKMGAILRENIEISPEPHFILKEGDRCPFLEENGLCRLICTLGEDSLCNICADHPRFRNFYENGIEMGLGLCCEEACRVILKEAEPFSVVGDDFAYSDEEKYIVNMRNKLISHLQDRSVSIKKRLDTILGIADIDISYDSFKEWREFFLSLERLDESWTELLSSVKTNCFSCPDDNVSLPLEQLCIYFIYRHLPSTIYGGNLSAIIGFSVLATIFIYTLSVSAIHRYQAFDDALCDVARMFSSEIEYSDENLEEIFAEFSF